MPDEPSFLQGVQEQPDGSLKSDILSDEGLAEVKDETPTTTEKPVVEAPKVEAKKEDVPADQTPPSTEEEPVYNATEILAKAPKDRLPEEVRELQKNREVLTDDQKKQLDGEEPVYIAEDILKKKPEERSDAEKKALEDGKDVLTDVQKKQLEDEAKVTPTPPAPTVTDPNKTEDKVQEEIRNINKVDDAKATELQKNIKLAQKFPLIDVKMPDINAFYKKDDKGEEEFQIADYMKAYNQTLIMAIQNSLVAGPLSAVTFGILAQAMKDDQAEATINSEADKEATAVLGALYKDFPRLKTDKEAEADLEVLIVGAWNKRIAEAKAKNEQPVKLTLEEVKVIATRLFGKKQEAPTTTQTEDPIEKDNGGVQLTPGPTRSRDEVSDDIAGMRNVGKGLSF